ncbi:MAG: hypothetical protein GY822_07960 [Deltaproteobacteria bacterium]|nr:hypothetical protein [Deltaproteobacteria bacterium]
MRFQFLKTWVSFSSASFFLALLVGCGTADSVVGLKTPAAFQVPKKLAGEYYLQFLAVGDVGTGGEGQKRIAKFMASRAAEVPVSFVLLLGDNFYGTGVTSKKDDQWGPKFHQMYNQPSLAVPFYASLGNHDHYSNPDAQVAHAKCCSDDRWFMPARYYTFPRQLGDGITAQFFAIDSYPIHSGRGESAAQLQWLEEELRKSTAAWKIVFGHHPLQSNGWHGDNPNMIRALSPLFKKYEVDLFLAGHDHDQQLLKPVDGVNYIITGAGAKSRNVRWEENTLYAATNLGFTAFRLSKDELLVEFINGEDRVDFAHVISHRPVLVEPTLQQPHVEQKRPKKSSKSRAKSRRKRRH